MAIAAAPAAVWRVLTDFALYPAWNPFFVALEGEARSGARLLVRVEPPGGRLRRLRGRIDALVPERELSWRGRYLLPGLVGCRHHIELAAAGEGETRLVQRQELRGLLAPLLPAGVLDTLRLGLAAMNEALKERVERPARPHHQPPPGAAEVPT